MKKTLIITPILSIVAVVFALIFGVIYVQKIRHQGFISVKGLGEVNFTSDLIVWEANFKSTNPNLKKGYFELDEKKKIIKKYLLDKGIKEDEIVFSSVNTGEKRKDTYNSKGVYTGSTFIAYELSQVVKIKSNSVDKIEKVSREITDLLNQNVELYSAPPKYFYTKLSDLKLNLISDATKDAKNRAEKIATFSGSQLSKLVSADMGIFQITGQYSDEKFTWGGSFNTSDKNKTASITMSLKYRIK